MMPLRKLPLKTKEGKSILNTYVYRVHKIILNGD